MEFEWDENKRLANIQKLSVDFVDMPVLFKNPMIERVDDSEDYGEERVIALGTANAAVYRIVFTLGKSRVRIISAMRASKNDQEIYYRSVYT